MNTIKTFATRDSATGLLRKMGIDKADYNKFISVTADNRQAVDVTAAEKHLKPSTKPADEAVSAEKQQLQARAEELREELKAKVKKAKRREEIITSRAKNWSTENPVKVAPANGQTQSAYVVSLIEAGHTNGEIFDALVKHYNAGKEKRGYPSWYRGMLRRQAAEKNATAAE